MHRYLSTILLLFVSATAWAQDSAPGDEADEPETAEAAASEEQDEDLDPEDENYQDAEEEDFVPTEDIPADQAIPFPTDI